MSITYTYTIINVDIESKCMEIVYAAEGKQSQHIGARLPYEGESLEQIVRLYSPERFWEEQDAVVLPVQIGTSGSLTPIIMSAENKAKAARSQRNTFLSACDWTQLPDANLTPQMSIEWQTYRQNLRDIPNQEFFPDTIDWFTPPSSVNVTQL